MNHPHQHHDHSGHSQNTNAMAASATLHCLAGCAIGEITGMIIGTAAGLPGALTIVISVTLAFIFGFALSTLPLLRAGLSLGSALGLVFVADTLSIATMETVDNLVMAMLPGAMNEGLVNVMFWIGMSIALTAAFFAAWPVNRYLLRRGKGHALLHAYHSAPPASGIRGRIPNFSTGALVAVIISFILGGLVVSFADQVGSTGQNSAMSMSDMNEDLSNKTGDEFDKAFIERMIEHHQGAIDMAEQAETNAQHQEIKSLSREIIRAQKNEISEMKQWQVDWGYGQKPHMSH